MSAQPHRFHLASEQLQNRLADVTPPPDAVYRPPTGPASTRSSRRGKHTLPFRDREGVRPVVGEDEGADGDARREQRQEAPGGAQPGQAVRQQSRLEGVVEGSG